MTILIVENDAFIVEDIKDMLIGLGYTKLYDTDTVAGALEMVKQYQPDIVLVDIDLNGDRNGIDLGNELDQQNIPFIYLSDQQSILTFNQAKATNPQSNLPKPVNQLQLRNALLEINLDQKTQADVPFVLLPDGDKKVRIDKADIVYLKAARNYCDVFVLEGKYDKNRYTSNHPMGTVFKLMNQADFVQVHRSACVNYNHVKDIDGNTLSFQPPHAEIVMSSNLKSHLLKKMPLA